MMIVGLGNPGPRYARNRHNVGFLFAEYLAGKQGASFKHKSSFDAEIAELRLEGEKAWLLKPLSFMNLSGGPVSRAAAYYKVEPRGVVVVYDDVALPFGTIRVRPHGSAGGHRGMQSIIEQLGTDQFPRIRVGIASDRRRADLAGYVLSDFASGERAALEEVFEHCLEALELVARGNVEQAMARYNRRNTPAGAEESTQPDDTR